MSYLTVEVEIDHGRIVASEPEKLPESGKGLLTIIQENPANAKPPEMTPLEAFRALQQRLQLDDKAVEAWKATICDARR